MTPDDVLIAGVEIAETPELAIMEISQTVVGALPETARNRYTTFVDLDNDPATGCNPAGLGLPTAFVGAELVTSVLFEAAGGLLPQLSTRVWRCEAGRLVPLSAVDIEARASDVELTDIELPSSRRSSVVSRCLSPAIWSVPTLMSFGSKRSQSNSKPEAK